jgi:hypothetical protein
MANALVEKARIYASTGDGVPKEAVRHIALLCEEVERLHTKNELLAEKAWRYDQLNK